MNKRDRFVAELPKEAKARGLSFKIEYWRGKGGHAMVYVEIDPKTARKIRKALDLD
jgi:hypothetical protein